MKYTDVNMKVVENWIEEGWKWGIPISHEEFIDAKNNNWKVYLTPTKGMPHNWFPSTIKGLKILGLASGGGQQMPIFSALGALCTCLDYSKKQLESEKMVARRENYQIELVKHDMTNGLPFPDNTFDIIFHPVSNCYIEEVEPLFKECYRVLKKGGILVSGLDNGINFISNDEKTIENHFPFNPLKDPKQLKTLKEDDSGVQFSHTMEEQIGGQLKAGFTLVDIYEDTNGEGYLHELNIPTFIATKSIKK